MGSFKAKGSCMGSFAGSFMGSFEGSFKLRLALWVPLRDLSRVLLG